MSCEHIKADTHFTIPWRGGGWVNPGDWLHTKMIYLPLKINRDHSLTCNLTLQDGVSKCPDVKKYKWRLNPVLHRMHYSCIHMAPVGIKGLTLCKSKSIASRQLLIRVLVPVRVWSTPVQSYLYEFVLVTCGVHKTHVAGNISNPEFIAKPRQRRRLVGQLCKMRQ